MNPTLRISVVIPAYNQGAYLAESLDGVLRQTYPVHEIIVVDDGSTDDTSAVLDRYRDRVTTIRQSNAGVSAARNTALDRASGNWVAFLDSDDVWEPRKLERQAALTVGEGVVCVHTGYRVFGSVQRIHETPREVLQGRYDTISLLSRVMVLPSTALVRHDAGVRFRPWAAVCEDEIYFAELGRLGHFSFIPEPLVRYRKPACGRRDRTVEGWQYRFRWVAEYSGLEGQNRDRFEKSMACVVAEEAELARWVRDWRRYWALRKYLTEIWCWPDPPAVVSERVYPRLVYFLKDFLDRRRQAR
ncbi:MAG: glycosyltransferase family 2 protein [Planctomycetes bacterium]|nr:glycosyltransferase family 2 protein [Planctomycetota bacterium]